MPLNEQQIINYLRPLAQNDQSFNLNDDIAAITIDEGWQLIVSKDLASSNIHFFPSSSGFQIAHQIMMPNLSDLASSGAKPLYYMLGIGKNNLVDKKFFEDFCQALKEIQEDYQIKLIGGDTINCQNDLTFSVTIFGQAKKDQILKRKNAREGELLITTGYIGDSYLGLKSLSNTLKVKSKKYFENKYYFSNPPVNFMHEIATKNLTKCAIDISDGFLHDLNEICHQSQLKANINLKEIPLSLQAINEKEMNKLDLISAGGDYQTIFSCQEKDFNKISQIAQKHQIKLTKITKLYKNNNKDKMEIKLFDDDKTQIKLKTSKLGFKH